MDKNQMMRFIAKRVAGELTPGTLVNLGVGIPTLVAEYIAPDSDILPVSYTHLSTASWAVTTLSIETSFFCHHMTC